MPVGVSRREQLHLFRFPGRYDLRAGDNLRLVLEPSLYAPAHDPEVTNRLQFAESLYLLPSVIDRAAIISVIIQNDRLTVLFAKVEEPAISDRQHRQACPL